jgi:hypothetical protein
MPPPREGLRKYGRASFADPVNNKYPIKTRGQINAAWAYVHQLRNGEKHTASEVRAIKARVRAPAKARKVALPGLGRGRRADESGSEEEAVSMRAVAARAYSA